jgi:hypothetical protein
VDEIASASQGQAISTEQFTSQGNSASRSAAVRRNFLIGKEGGYISVSGR